MISGANRGIGMAIAQKLYAAGFSLSLGARTPNSLPAIPAEGEKHRFIIDRYDAEDQKSHKQWVVHTVHQFGRVDGLVNNAGVAESVSVEDMKDDLLDRMWAINVKGPLSMTRTALPHLRRSGAGRIINVASLAGKAVYDSGIGYSMTKFAAVALSHATRHAGWNDGVRCTALCPGYVATDMTAEVTSLPREKMIETEDIAEIIRTILTLSNNASIAELMVNTRNDMMM